MTTFDRRMLIPISVDRCHCCEQTVACVRVPVRLGPYTTNVPLCEICIDVCKAAFDVAAQLRVEDAAARLRSGS